MTIFHFTLKRIFSNVTNIVILTLFPVAFIFFPAAEDWPFLPYGYQYFGILILFISIRLTTMLLEDRKKGLLKRFAVAPISHFQYLTQNLLAFAVILMAQCVIVVFGGVIVGQELYQPLWLLLVFISFSFASLAIALAWVSFFKNKDLAFLSFMSLIFVMILAGGLMVPVEIFPDLLERFAYILPTYWLAEGIHWVVWEEDFGDILLINGVLWLYTVVFIIIGSTKRLN